MAFLKRSGGGRFSLRGTNLRLLILCLLCSAYGCMLVFSANYSAGSGMRGTITQIGATVIGFWHFSFPALTMRISAAPGRLSAALPFFWCC